MAEGLRARLIGAWKLVSYREFPVDGSDPFEPLGAEPRGIIMFTPCLVDFYSDWPPRASALPHLPETSSGIQGSLMAERAEAPLPDLSPRRSSTAYRVGRDWSGFPRARPQVGR